MSDVVVVTVEVTETESPEPKPVKHTTTEPHADEPFTPSDSPGKPVRSCELITIAGDTVKVVV